MTHSSVPDLYALIVRLTAVQNGTLRATQGHLAHAAFLHILRQADPDLAQTIHDSHGRKPFTISPLTGFGHGQQGRLEIRAGQSGWLRITLLDPILFHAFIQQFLTGSHAPVLQLDGLSFQISEILSSPGSHPLAGYASLESLTKDWADCELYDAHSAIVLTFRTPTAFSLRNERFRYMLVLPDPVAVFGELAGYWDRLTGSVTQDAVRLASADSVVVARHDIQTHMYQYRRSKQVGFTGKVAFNLLDRSNLELTRHLNRLADLAFFTGLGLKTTMGMGQVSRSTD